MATTDHNHKAVQRAAKFLLDNPEFNVLYDYLEDQTLTALVQGSYDDAGDNLRIHRALVMFKQAAENLQNG